MKKLILIALTFISFGSHSQMFRASYNMALPIGQYTDYVSNMSFKGWEIGYQHEIGRNLTAGFNYKWQKFYEKHDRATYEFENGAITSSLYTYTFVNNLNASLNYYIENNSRITPYVGLSIGPAYVKNRVAIGFIDYNDYAWKISLAPEIGALIKVNDEFSVDMRVTYNYLPMQYDAVKSTQYIGFCLGFNYDRR